MIRHTHRWMYGLLLFAVWGCSGSDEAAPASTTPNQRDTGHVEDVEPDDVPRDAQDTSADDVFRDTTIDTTLDTDEVDAVAQARWPEPGEVLITEIMYDPHFELEEGNAEWFELRNTSSETVGLGGCDVRDAEGNITFIAHLNIDGGERVLFSRTDDLERNGGVVFDHLFDFSLDNSGDTLVVQCGDQTINQVRYSGDDFPTIAPAHSLSLEANSSTNADGALWCSGSNVYYLGNDAEGNHFGSPGITNPRCSLCRPNPCLTPPEPTCDEGMLSMSMAPGVCDESTNMITCTYPEQRTACADEMVCQDGQCVPNRCIPDPCTAPPEPRCDEDGVTLITPMLPGTCSTQLEEPLCIYLEEQENCANGGGFCQDGHCVGQARQPRVGEVIISEIMYDAGALEDNNAEWFEVYSGASETLTLEGCHVEDGNPLSTAIGSILIRPGRYLVFARTDDPELNGGLAPDHLFDFSLNDSAEGDTIALRCGETVVDHVSYSDRAPWPSEQGGTAIQLDRRLLDAVSNDAPEHWCLATRIYFSVDLAENRGTPGELNPICSDVEP